MSHKRSSTRPYQAEIHRGRRYVAALNYVSDAPEVVITFEPYSSAPVAEGNWFAARFCEHRRLNWIGIKTDINDWYLTQEIHQVIRAVRRATAGMRRVGYGSSMGGYAIINFADALALDECIAISPQFSPDSAKLPPGADLLDRGPGMDYALDAVATRPRLRNGYLLYDPGMIDAEHASLILARHALTPILLRGADHNPLQLLNEAGLAEQMLTDMFRGRFNRAAFMRRYRVQRKSSQWFWLTLARRLRTRRPAAALRAAEAAIRLPGPNTPEIELIRFQLEASGHGRTPLPALPTTRPFTGPATTGFAAGTLIATPGGNVPVEALVDGEMVHTGSGEILPITRVAKRRFDLDRHPLADMVRPIRIMPNALADGVPAQPLIVAPDQLLAIDGVMVAARHVLNSTTIARVPASGMIVYFQPGLADDGTLVAGAVVFEGLPAAGSQSVDRDGPLAQGGPELEAIRARLLARAKSMGFALTEEPALQLEIAGRHTPPEDLRDRIYSFNVPAQVSEVRLCSRSMVPLELMPGSTDGRRLGVAISRVVLAQGDLEVEVPIEQLGPTGFHQVEAIGGMRWRWTDGYALLRLPATRTATRLTLHTAMSIRYWANPPVVPPEPHLSAHQRTALDTTEMQRRRVVFISGEPGTPGDVYRVMRPARAAAAAGFDSRTMSLDQVPARVDEIRQAHTVILWRTKWGPATEAAVAAAHHGNARILLDLDDLMIDPIFANPDYIDAIRQNRFDVDEVRGSFDAIATTFTASHGGIATTAELAAHMRARHRPVHVLPNGFDAATLGRARLALRRRRAEPDDELVRIGYAGGTRTHQMDFAVIADALARLLRQFRWCRLVLFRERSTGLGLVDIEEFPTLAQQTSQIEWRDTVALDELPDEMVRFDINLAPLEVGNPFCEAKSELKYFEAALVEVCTVASPTGPFARAIRDGETGFLAADDADWYRILRDLVRDADLRRRVGANAYHSVLWPHGEERRAELLAEILAQGSTGRQAAHAFELSVRRVTASRLPLPRIPDSETLFRYDALGQADATVIIPLYNYAEYIKEALDSAIFQTERTLDLVVVDDASTDDGLAVVLEWLQLHRTRFNRVLALRNLRNSGLGLTRNAGFATAETPYVLPLDADNRLFPQCVSKCLDAIRDTGASFAYPRIVQFGDQTETIGTEPFSAQRFVGGNYVDAMALVRKAAWAAVGGYDHVPYGWEDYDFWCRLVENGHYGVHVDQTLAQYRVHAKSMLRVMTEIPENRQKLSADIKRRHPWVEIGKALQSVPERKEKPRARAAAERLPARRFKLA